MKNFLFLLIAAVAFAQRPYVEAGASLNSGGYSPFSVNGRAGINVERERVIANFFAGYDTARKRNDGTIGNDKGHIRDLAGTAFYRFGNWHMGGGYRFSQTATTNYTKQNGHILAGGGHDWATTRIDALYLSPALDEYTRYPDGTSCRCTNNVQGIEVGIWLPNPHSNHHLFWHQTVTTIWFHDTQFAPNVQKPHSTATFINFNLMYRF